MLTQAVIVRVLFLLASGAAVLNGMQRFMREHGITDKNYRGESIPTACGLFMLLLLIFAYLFHKAVPTDSLPVSADFVLGAFCVGFAGLLDDLIGDKQTKGIANHWNAWIERGVLSTAIVKAAAASASGFILFSSKDGLGGVLLFHLLILLLSTNAANLMDVRPGRAFKFFYAMLLILLAVIYGWKDVVPSAELASGCLLPIVVGAAILTYPDLKGKLMLGDTGANLLGFSIGCGFIWCSPMSVQVPLLLLLIALHAVTWKMSLTRIIENNRWLRFIDGLGRKRIE